MEDTDPHRRNLMVISTMFIVYFLSGGHINFEKGLALGVVSIDFERPIVIQIAAWMMLFFFGWRYYLKADNSALRFDAACREVAQENRWLMKSAINGCTAEEIKSFNLDRVRVSVNIGEDLGWKFWKPLKFSYTLVPVPDKDGGVYRSNSGSSDLSALKAALIRVQILLPAATKNQEFSDRILPYMMFLLAVVVGLYNLAWHDWLVEICNYLEDCF